MYLSFSIQWVLNIDCLIPSLNKYPLSLSIIFHLRDLCEKLCVLCVKEHADKTGPIHKELIHNIEAFLDVSVPPIRIPYWMGLLSVALCEGDACWAAMCLTGWPHYAKA